MSHRIRLPPIHGAVDEAARAMAKAALKELEDDLKNKPPPEPWKRKGKRKSPKPR